MPFPMNLACWERGQLCPRGHGCPRSASWEAPFRFSVCIGTMNQIGTPLPALSPHVGERFPRSEHSRVETPEPRDNIERPTSNFERRSEGGFALPFDVRCSSGFMERENLQNSDANRGHEPVGIPLNRPPGACPPAGGEGRGEGVRFRERIDGTSRSLVTVLQNPLLAPRLWPLD